MCGKYESLILTAGFDHGGDVPHARLELLGHEIEGRTSVHHAKLLELGELLAALRASSQNTGFGVSHSRFLQGVGRKRCDIHTVCFKRLRDKQNALVLHVSVIIVLALNASLTFTMMGREGTSTMSTHG
jgi:hypothetical protein